MKTAADKSESLQQFYRALQQSPDYRSFLKIYLSEKGLNISDFARATGFSRSYPSDVLSKKRRLTQASQAKFEKALKLPAQGKKLFTLLVAAEEKNIFPDWDRSKLRAQIQDLQTRSWVIDRRRLDEAAAPSVEELLGDSRVMSIYAAAGEPEHGASLEEIQKRTRLYGQELDRNLKKLENAGFLKQQDQRYFPKDLHLFLQTANQSQILKTVFSKACRLASERVQNPESNHEMFFCSSFCIKEEMLPELKIALREIILKYVDDSIRADGDRVVRLVTALHF